MDANTAKEQIVRLLGRSTEGMTITQLAKSLNLHRHTTSRYVLVLQETGRLECLEDGRAKKCILKRARK